MKNTVLKFGSYGFVTGLIIFLIHLIIGVDNFDSNTNEIVGYISIFISLAFIYFGIKHFRDNVNNGVVSFGKAISIGLMISMCVGLGIAIADFIYTKFIDPEFFYKYEALLTSQGKADEIIELTSTTAALFMLALVIIIGFIISLLSGLILQRKH